MVGPRTETKPEPNGSGQSRTEAGAQGGRGKIEANKTEAEGGTEVPRHRLRRRQRSQLCPCGSVPQLRRANDREPSGAAETWNRRRPAAHHWHFAGSTDPIRPVLVKTLSEEAERRPRRSPRCMSPRAGGPAPEACAAPSRPRHRHAPPRTGRRGQAWSRRRRNPLLRRSLRPKPDAGAFPLRRLRPKIEAPLAGAGGDRPASPTCPLPPRPGAPLRRRRPAPAAARRRSAVAPGNGSPRAARSLAPAACAPSAPGGEAAASQRLDDPGRRLFPESRRPRSVSRPPRRKAAKHAHQAPKRFTETVEKGGTTSLPRALCRSRQGLGRSCLQVTSSATTSNASPSRTDVERETGQSRRQEPPHASSKGVQRWRRKSTSLASFTRAARYVDPLGRDAVSS